MRYTIQYNDYSALIDTLGAEVIELKKVDTNILWNRNKDFWADSALVLFPFIGRNYNDTYAYNNNEYNMPIHGFSTRSNFELVEHLDNSLTLILKDNEETYKNYPFHFEFIVKYELNDHGLNVEFKVTNKSDVVMPYVLGYHPGFILNKELSNYSIKFNNPTSPSEIGIVTKCMLNGNNAPLQLTDNKLQLNKDLFNYSAKVYTGVGNDVSLLDQDKQIVNLKYNGFKNIVLWQTLNSDADFICIEGWDGLPGKFEHIDDIMQDQNKSFLKPNDTHLRSVEINF